MNAARERDDAARVVPALAAGSGPHAVEGQLGSGAEICMVSPRSGTFHARGPPRPEHGGGDLGWLVPRTRFSPFLREITVRPKGPSSPDLGDGNERGRGECSSAGPGFQARRASRGARLRGRARPCKEALRVLHSKAARPIIARSLAAVPRILELRERDIATFAHCSHCFHYYYHTHRPSASQLTKPIRQYRASRRVQARALARLSSRAGGPGAGQRPRRHW